VLLLLLLLLLLLRVLRFSLNRNQFLGR